MGRNVFFECGRCVNTHIFQSCDPSHGDYRSKSFISQHMWYLRVNPNVDKQEKLFDSNQHII